MLNTDKLETALWLAAAKQGWLRMPRDATGLSEAMTAAVHHATAAKLPDITVWINCREGDKESWGVVEALLNFPGTVTTITEDYAWSAGLWVLLAGRVRLALPRTSFIAHGERDHWRREEDDVDRTQFLASRTQKGSAFWQEAFLSEEFEFDTDSALQYGVIDECLPRDELRMRLRKGLTQNDLRLREGMIR